MSGGNIDRGFTTLLPLATCREADNLHLPLPGWPQHARTEHRAEVHKASQVTRHRSPAFSRPSSLGLFDTTARFTRLAGLPVLLLHLPSAMSVSSQKKEPIHAPRMKSMPSFENIDGTFIERTKAGTISRMRSHNGNKPMIPQNHRCSLCPAKFTRVTHLQRHMRTRKCSSITYFAIVRVDFPPPDSDQRQYTCDVCKSIGYHDNQLTRLRQRCSGQFTRSDLLTRHKRTCGDP